MRAWWCSGALLLAASCGVGAEPAALAVRLQSLSGSLPSDVAKLRVLYRVGDAPSVLREASLDELSASGGKRRLTLDELPSDVPVSLTVEGFDRGGQLAYAGGAGPLALGAREQLKLPITLYARARSEALPSAVPPPRFLHAATALDDGRVLITGGFGTPHAVSCPASAPAESLCFRAEARDDAWLFEPSSASFHELPGGMLEARGGHSATVLPEGRALVAGGARAVTLVLVAHEGGYEPHVLGVDGANAPATLASFELFDAWPLEPARARDPARGRFVGPEGAPDAPGTLERTRFLHAAAASLAHPSRVLLSGGAEPTSAESCEVFDAARAGGPGVIGEPIALPSPRMTPAAVALQHGQASFVWIFGGREARSNDELADRWFSGALGSHGTVAAATESAFPNLSSEETDARPAYAFTRPLAVALAGGAHAFVTGGLGPRCAADGQTADFAGAHPCTGATVLRAAFLTSAATGSTRSVDLPSPHILGAATSLPSGEGLLSGGFASLALDAHAKVHVLRAEPALSVQARTLVSARALHTSTAFGAAGVLSVGGVVLRGGALELVPGCEVLWL